MANYIQIEFQYISADQTGILIAGLSDIGFEGFEEGENELKAFIPEDELDEDALKDIAGSQDLSFTRTVVEETNWNALWESSFQPVVVDDFAGIRAEFHEPIKGVKQEIIITPKMSFGTGHHATTFMMIRQMSQMNFTGKTILDFGTGTGILAILAEKLGAAKVVAVDHDEWSISNAEENSNRNNCSKIILKKAGSAAGDEQYDIILANINKNVIMDNISQLVKQLSPGGILLLSGLLLEDEPGILAALSKFPLQAVEKTTHNNWISLRFNH